MRVYFVGIGGSGLSPLAQLALDCGFKVCGSDKQHSLGTEAVEQRGVLVYYDQDGKQLKHEHETNGVDWVIFTAALDADHPELKYAQEHNIKCTKRDEFLNFVLETKNLKLIAVAGTHGKTSTTAMFVWTFQQLGIPISYLIGSNIGFGPSARFQPGSVYFVLECDEFDRNFLKFHPEISVVTNIDYDHPDVYANEDEYNYAFQEFINQTSSVLIIWDDSYQKVKTAIKDNLHIFTPRKVDKNTNEVFQQIQLVGEHNRENAFLVVSVLFHILKFNVQDIINNVSNYPGSQRRMEKLSEFLYSDYAHHPTEIAATLQMTKELSSKIVVVYQPHQNVRQYEIRHLYTDCFHNAKKIYWLPTHLSREKKGLDVLLPVELIQNLSNKDEVVISDFNSDLLHKVSDHLYKGDTVVCMGAGSIDNWARMLANEVKNSKVLSASGV